MWMGDQIALNIISGDGDLLLREGTAGLCAALRRGAEEVTGMGRSIAPSPIDQNTDLARLGSLTLRACSSMDSVFTHPGSPQYPLLGFCVRRCNHPT